MFRIVPGIIAVFAFAMVSLAAASPAEAQAKRCKKVSIDFACRNRGSGKTVLPCRGGETEAQCCARLKKAASDPRRGWCTGNSGGLASFKCACAKTKGGKRPEADAAIRRVSPDVIDPASAAESQSGTARSRAGTVLEDIEIEKEVDRTSVPLVQADSAHGPAAKACRKVKYAFACRRGGGKAKGEARCGRGEDARACCARVRRLANRSCSRHGGVAKLKCGCSRPRPGGGPGGEVTPGPGPAEAGGDSFFDVFVDVEIDEDSTADETPALKENACPQVNFSYLCGRDRRTGRRRCRRGESQRDCCDQAHSVETRNCGAVPRRWKCRCVNASGRLRRIR